jgi:hypothetical protein
MYWYNGTFVVSTFPKSRLSGRFNLSNGRMSCPLDGHVIKNEAKPRADPLGFSLFWLEETKVIDGYTLYWYIGSIRPTYRFV